jgi:outer membrane protein assembly factor BamA
MMGAFIMAASLAVGVSPAPVSLSKLLPAEAFLRQSAGEVVAEVRIHGNHVSTDDEVFQASGLTIGTPFTATTIADVTARLRASGKFDDVDVLKRFASIADPSRIVVVIIVNEGPVRIQIPIDSDAPVRMVRRRGLTNFMVMPILDAEDGYGFTYGARIAYVGLGGKRGRLSFPATWGGLKRVSVEFDRRFEAGPVSRVELGGALQRQRNPAFDENDDRRRVWARAERYAGPLRAGGTVGWQRVSFAGGEDRMASGGVDVAIDTRVDPGLPRNAVYAVASWEHLSRSAGPAINRTRLDGRGYLGLVGQTVLVARVVRTGADRATPPYLKSLLGGWSSLRGFKAGAFYGDTLVAGSLELRVPLTSPLDIGRLGVSLFVDSGTVYDRGERLRDQPLHTGAGGSVWVTLTAFRMELAVAHGRGAGTRVNFGGGFTF